MTEKQLLALCHMGHYVRLLPSNFSENKYKYMYELIKPYERLIGFPVWEENVRRIIIQKEKWDFSKYVKAYLDPLNTEQLNWLSERLLYMILYGNTITKDEIHFLQDEWIPYLQERQVASQLGIPVDKLLDTITDPNLKEPFCLIEKYNEEYGEEPKELTHIEFISVVNEPIQPLFTYDRYQLPLPDPRHEHFPDIEGRPSKSKFRLCEGLIPLSLYIASYDSHLTNDELQQLESSIIKSIEETHFYVFKESYNWQVRLGTFHDIAEQYLKNKDNTKYLWSHCYARIEERDDIPSNIALFLREYLLPYAVQTGVIDPFIAEIVNREIERKNIVVDNKQATIKFIESMLAHMFTFLKNWF